jgi:putative restriction endonuclease
VTMELSPIVASRLGKAASDNGFDQELERDDGWLVFVSTQCPLRVWLGTSDDAMLLIALSQSNVVSAIDGFGMQIAAPIPNEAVAGYVVPDVPALHKLLRRAFQLSKALPNELLHTFEKEVAMLPKTTEAERLVVQRVGQDLFREGLLDFWERRCAVTGLTVTALLRASHIKPWASCETDAERLDVYNGLLLAPHLDAAFDRGFITVTNDGLIVVSDMLSTDAISILGLDKKLRIQGLKDGHRTYLAWHHDQVFQDEEKRGWLA